MLSKDLVIAERFRLIRMIGKGGMGSVWEAKHLGLDTPCALKFIEGELANLQEAHARFEREAKAAAQLRSQHIVQVFDHGVWQGTPYIAMELLNGVDLGKRLAESGGWLKHTELLPIISQVCRALKKAHQGGFVHRDLKPDNIFLCKEDDGAELVKILDFGVAKQTGQAIDGSNTKTGAMLGTPYYMSPEQAQGIKEVRGTSDLWSLAVIVYQCLTGRLPFDSEALGDLLFKIFTHEAVPPAQVKPGLPPALDDWWRKAAAKAPEQRYQNASDFNDALHSVFGDVTQMERSRELRQLGGGTAVMAQVPNTPNPYAPQQTAAMATPNPYPQHTQAMSTPQNLGQSPIMTPQQPMQATPMGQSQPGTFSGAEAPVGVPKKGPPVAIIAAVFLALLVLGGAFGGYAIVKSKSAAAAAGSASASVSVANPEPPTSVTAPTPSASAAPSAAVAGNDPPPTTPSDPPPPSAKPGQIGHRPPPPVVTLASAKPPTTPPPPPTKPTTTTPAVRPTSTLGF